MEHRGEADQDQEAVSCLRLRLGSCRHQSQPQPPPCESSHQRAQEPAGNGTKRKSINATGGSSQFSSFILFASVIILINLCSFQMDPPQIRPPSASDNNAQQQQQQQLETTTAATTTRIVTTKTTTQTTRTTSRHEDELLSMALQQPQSKYLTNSLHINNDNNNNNDNNHNYFNYLTYLDSCLEFVKLMFSQPMRLSKRTTRYTFADARILGKMAKVWYIKKKVKKLGKKLKKHTIAVPVFTAIPIYEHSYYPQPHVTHVSHGGGHMHAASSYSPTTVAAVAQPVGAAHTLATSASQQQMATSSSNQHQVAAAAAAAYSRMAAHPSAPRYSHPMGTAASHHIINAYAPSPPLYVDDSGGLYGHYGNAYGRYDGGYHVW